MLGPVMPNGRPIEIEPPLTLLILGSVSQRVTEIEALARDGLVQLNKIQLSDPEPSCLTVDIHHGGRSR
jgi:hypothetical protein